MPFSIGAHPAFALPQSFGSYALQFDHETLTSYELENDLLSNKTNRITTNNGILLSPIHYLKKTLIFKKLASKNNHS
jgi:galactose mutarotase-like enzyme